MCEYNASHHEAVWRKPDQSTHTGSIALEAEGVGGWYADKIFIPDGETKTIAQLLDEKTYQRNQDHYKKLVEYLQSHLGE